MEAPPASVGSTLSWNTFLSRTSVSTLTCAIFSEQQRQSVHGLEDVIRAVSSLRLRHYRYEELAREETLGEGETYLVEKCAVQGGSVFAVKHLKMSNTADEKTFRRRLSAVTVEAQIMRHSPLRAHPNLPSAIGYGWNLRGKSIIPFLVVEYAPLGTLREYIRTIAPALADIEILLGDVASAIAALHTCGIVHGDVKLDNVLVFPSWDRPAKALAKLTDFGHALILNDKSKKKSDEIVKYGGTVMYNAPEVRTQDLFPIDRTELWKCDMWAFGLLVWEACIGGEEYMAYLSKNGVIPSASSNDPGISATEMLHYAKSCLPSRQLGTPMFLRVALHKTIQEDPLKRATSIRDLPLYTRWNTGDLLGLEADLALHFETPTPTYEMFRLDTGKEILWDHQQQIFQGLKHTYTNNLARERGPISWQIALCYHVGFGTIQDPQNAYEYAKVARSESHPLATVFGYLLDPRGEESPGSPEETYCARISSLLHSDSNYPKGMPNLVRAFFDGNSSAVLDLLSEGVSLSSSTVDGCSPFHWLFMFQDVEFLGKIVGKLQGDLTKRLVNLPMCSVVQVHDQWPLQFLGSPIAVAISVNSLPAVKALLSLGADPFSLVYDRALFPSEDPRSQWTAFHIAAKYHCSDILAHLLDYTKSRQQTSINSLACVLSLSTVLERLAMHGSHHTKQLNETVRLVRSIQPLGAMDTNGRTGLMEAIDFQDRDVVAALLRADKDLAKVPFRSPQNPNIFTYPIHFAAQIAARRDVLETLSIPRLIDSHTDELGHAMPSLDHMGRTLLHLAGTGTSSIVASWVLEEHNGLIHVEDQLGRTPLHYCTSAANCNLLLDKGADVNHTDKYGMAALHRACFLGASELVACLLKRKPSLDLKDNVYGTPLHCGVISGSVDVVMALLEESAPLNATDINGNTVIHVAARLKRHNILRLLIQQGAEVSLLNNNGRDAKAIALNAARLGNLGILSILRHGKEPQQGERVLETIDDDMETPVLEHESESNLSPDFLWDEASLSVAEPAEPTILRQSAADDPYTYDKEQETYEQRQEKLENFEQITSTITEHLPNLYKEHWAATAVISLISVFFDGNIWQPGLRNRIIEAISRAVHDLVCIIHHYSEEVKGTQERAEAWAVFLATHKKIAIPLRVKTIQNFVGGDQLLEEIQKKHSRVLPALDPYEINSDYNSLERLEAVWKYMHQNDPVEIPDEIDEEPSPPYDEKKSDVPDDGLFWEQMPLKHFLSFVERGFPVQKVPPVIPPAYDLYRDMEDMELFDVGNLLQKDSDDVQLTEQNSELPVSDNRDDERSMDEDEAENELEDQSQETPKSEDSCRHEGVGSCYHVDLAIDWITTIVMDRKPGMMFPGRQKVDIEEMARWEMKAYKMPEPQFGVTHYSSTLFQNFPQLAEQSWRESSSREYLEWKHKKNPVFQQRNSEYGRRAFGERIAVDEFFKTLYASCTQRVEEVKPEEDSKAIEDSSTLEDAEFRRLIGLNFLKESNGRLKRIFK